MPEPVMPWQVTEGGSYWAAMGDTKWSAVRIISRRRKTAHVERVNARTGAVTTRNAKCKLSELVRRDPKLKGKDKPEKAPREVFEGVRKAAKPEPKPEPEPSTPTAPTKRNTPLDKNFLRDVHLRFLQDYHGMSEAEAKLEWENLDNDW